MRELNPKQRVTKRELEVARLVAQGLTNKEIGRALFISQRTAEGHIAQICNKLGFSTRSQVAAWAATFEATAAAPPIAPKLDIAVPPAPVSRPGRRVISATGARWIGLAIIVVGLVSAGIVALKLGSPTASPDSNTVVDGLSRPNGIAVDPAGAILILDGNRVRKVSGGSITLVAGTGTNGFSGDGESAKLAKLNLLVYPGTVAHGLAVDSAGNVYIADYGNHRIRKVNVAGTITTIAGTDTAGGSGDGGPASKAQLMYPRGLAIDQQSGNLYIADSGTNRVRVIDGQGIIHAFAGSGDTGDLGDGDDALTAHFNGPTGLAFEQKSGNLYIADSTNNRVRKVTREGKMTTVAGTGAIGGGGDGGPATKATLNVPVAIAIDERGDVFIADSGNNRVRRIDAGGTITTVAAGVALKVPLGVAIDTSGYVLVADTYNDRVVRFRQ
jgi:DNA-binding CsgD family transcriptional regulator/DNA-binding beta-propeller fold protein YncE